MIEAACVTFPKDSVTIRRYGPNDYAIYFDNADCSVRGTLQDIIEELCSNADQLV